MAVRPSPGSRGVIPRCRYHQGGLVTERLRLVPFGKLPEAVDPRDGALLAAHLRVEAPPAWPPRSLDEHLEIHRRLRETGEGGSGFLLWFLILKGRGRRSPSLVGICGFRELPDEEGGVELRYEVLPPFQRRGLATEGAEALVAWAFESHWARLIRARTTREELGAMQVLAKLGFTLIGTADDGRAYLFELEQREEGKS